MTAHFYSARRSATDAPGKPELFTHRSSDYALRADLYGGVAHFFQKQDLANPYLQWLIPWCSEGATYPERVPHDEVTLNGLADAIRCGACQYRAVG